MSTPHFSRHDYYLTDEFFELSSKIVKAIGHVNDDRKLIAIREWFVEYIQDVVDQNAD